MLSGGGAGGESAAGEASRLEALRWVEFLLARARAAVLEQLPALLPALLDSLLAQVGVTGSKQSQHVEGKAQYWRAAVAAGWVSGGIGGRRWGW